MNAPFRIVRMRLVQLRIFSYRVRSYSLSHLKSRPLSSVREELRAGEKESISVKGCMSGSISVDIFNHHVLRDPSAPLVVYLPPTGAHFSEQHPLIPSYLFSTSAALAQINYRWNIPVNGAVLSQAVSKSNPHYPFPIPLHDILQAWSHITETYLPSFVPKELETSSLSNFESAKFQLTSKDLTTRRPIMIYGEFLGAALATSLALTESIFSFTNSFRIAGLIAKQGIYDWLNVEDQASSPLYPRSRGIKPDKKLEKAYGNLSVLDLRRRLFSDPEGCFDAFASPVFFFRTAGIPVPKDWVNIDFGRSDMSQISKISEERNSSENISPLPSDDESYCSRPDMMAFRTGLRFPPPRSKLEIPRTLLLCRNQRLCSWESARSEGRLYPRHEISGIDFVDQTNYLARCMRRSVNLSEIKGSRTLDQYTTSSDTESSKQTIQVYNLGCEFEEEKTLVKEWIEGCLL